MINHGILVHFTNFWVEKLTWMPNFDGIYNTSVFQSCSIQLCFLSTVPSNLFMSFFYLISFQKELSFLHIYVTQFNFKKMSSEIFVEIYQSHIFFKTNQIILTRGIQWNKTAFYFILYVVWGYCSIEYM